MPTSEDANDPKLTSEAHDEDGELTVNTLDKVVGGALTINKTNFSN